MKIHEIYDEIEAELERAIVKFPLWPTDPIHAAAVLAEEAGEVVKAALDMTYEKTATIEDFRNELIQTAAMAIQALMNIEDCEPKQSEMVVKK